MIREAGMYLLTAALGTNAKETAFSGILAVGGLAVTEYLGGWDKPLQILVWLLIADYITGVLGAIKQRKVNSEVMFWGGVRKAIVIAVIGFAALIDGWVSAGSPVFRTIAIYFYAAREGLSVFENLGVLGLSVPPKFKQYFEQMSDKGEGK